MTSKQTALETVKELVERFNEQLPAYKKTDYNETQTRRDFIDPFFKALGWDIDNKQGAAESYREVIHEDRVKVGKATKAPDYSFRLGGGKRLFFVEAKKPSVLIKDDIQPAYQVRRYGWSAKLNVSIITDFEEFAIYDCSKKPNPTDKSSVARVKYFTFNDYEKEWDFLWNTFSKEAVLKGSFDKFLQGTANKKGTATVDKEFLISLDQWRTLLAENISKDNKQLNEDELNFVVQQTLDRIIFLRICEDRSIEPYASLQEAVKNGDYYKNLLQLFKQADDKYNSGLFDFKKDTLSHTLQINNKALKSIITQLYYPECPYEFSVLSVEILGSAYEQFLGKTITINAKGKAVIELKPEVRKAGGVYYTPQYIVDYIVQNTIGKLCENKTPKEVAEIKIVDPACGSGSFLLGAYQYLLHWHKDYYTHNPNKKNPLTPEGNLTTAEKKRILLNNIYGVDIDTNAVEVTKLSLLLKCMEGETQASIAHQFTMFNDRVLPTLDENIKSGNSLIDTDYYDTQIDFGEERKIKPFNWQKAFPSVFSTLRGTKQSGFDVVIGNPPYVKEYTSKETFEQIKQSHLKKYYQGKMDLWYFFVCFGIDILKPNGFLGFIVPNNWVTNAGASILRNKILKDTTIKNIVDFGSYMVFENASIQTMVLLLENKKNNSYQFDYRKLENERPTFSNASTLLNYGSEHGNKLLTPWINKDELIDKYLVFGNAENSNILDKIKAKQNFILSKSEVANGIHPHYDFISKSINEKHFNQFNVGDGIFGLSHKELENLKLEKNELELIKPYYFNSNKIGRYYFNNENDNWIIYTNSEFKKENSMDNYPNLKRHLDKFKNVITSDNKPYGLHRSREEFFFIGEKIIALRKSTNRPVFSYSNSKAYISATFYLIKSDRINLKYLTGLLNSNLIAYWLRNKGKMQGNNYQIDKEPILEIPIFKTLETKSHDQIVTHVTQLLQLNKDLQTSTLQTQKDQIKSKIEYFEDKINKLVYQLYDLSEEEIKIVENN